MAKQQLHKRFNVEQVKAILEKYTNGELTTSETMRYLEIGRTRLFQLSEEYQKDKEVFSITYVRTKPSRVVLPEIEKNILKELAKEKKTIIDNPTVPVSGYNYSYLKNLLKEEYDQEVSVPTIINRAKKAGYWKPKPGKKIHDREVITNYTGELIQHDSSHHLFAPESGSKWYLITSLDDHSRMMVYADLWEKESSWAHISAVQSVVLNYGVPLAYYADQHSIFRYVKDRDKPNPFLNYTKFTDEVDPQWKQVLNELQVKTIYALSPQAKGKIERPYQWLQDHLVRSCVRNNVTTIVEAREILRSEIMRYNTHQVHSTTGEVPLIRFEKARRSNQTLFRDFILPPSAQSIRDVFCLRMKRIVDGYRTISLQNLKLQVPGGIPKQEVELRLSLEEKTKLVEARFWIEGKLTGTAHIKPNDLPNVQF